MAVIPLSKVSGLRHYESLLLRMSRNHAVPETLERCPKDPCLDLPMIVDAISRPSAYNFSWCTTAGGVVCPIERVRKYS